MKKFLLFVCMAIICSIASFAETNISLLYSTAHQISSSYDKETSTYSFITTGTDPYVYVSPLSKDLESTEIKLTFDYICESGLENLCIYYGPYYNEMRVLKYGNLSATSEWKTATIDINYAKNKFFWGRDGQAFRFDLGEKSGVKIQIKNVRICDVAPNIKGKITCSSKGVPGVYVSDGFVITQTDANGQYSMYSNKKNGYVYYEIPAGYMPYENYQTTNEQRIFTEFWHQLNYPNTLTKVETHDFKLKLEENKNFRMIIGADPQLSYKNSGDDVRVFNTLTFPRFAEEKANAGTLPLYSSYMGDLAWDNYWYKNSWSHGNYKANFATNYNFYKIKHFSVMGNHDHDGAIYNSDSVDFSSAWSFRKFMGPNYFSYNIGNIHFISLDDLIYKNEDTGGSYSKGIVGTRNYDTGFSDLVVDWAQRDLAKLDANTTVVLCVHAPLWYISDVSQTTTSYNRVNQTYIEQALKRFKQVMVLSGHRHVTYTMHPTSFSNIVEKSFGACGGDLYNASYYSGLSGNEPGPTGVGRPVCTDGTPGGYQIFNFNGEDISWKFIGFEDDNNGQFHVYDVNSIKKFETEDDIMKAIVAADKSTYSFSSLANNSVIINVFNFDPAWKVEAFENGKALNVSPYKCRDYYYMHAYSYFYYKANKKLPDAPGFNYHSFLTKCSDATTPITVKVTDRFGNVYTRTVQRPHAITLDAMAIGEGTEICTNVNNVEYAKATNNIYTAGGKIIIDAEKPGKAFITHINGASKVVNITSGTNTIEVGQKGIVIVTVDGTSKKMYIK